ncbi:hypothetical protein BB561_005674 [Smittium simulii]|uniref:ATP synthase subunit gamma n=1 Tax=Smittium simulii TaxID=133385 RepID=A0A2T9Y937_9FUNG|nr:hypothetical protein BB561_005674 [Smittium simulii]
MLLNLSQQTCRSVLSARASLQNQSLGQSVRNMATLKEIQIRLKSITNISKITASMKMIASTKTARAQRSMEAARQNGIISADCAKFTEVKDQDEAKKILIVSSSDKGLCGGIHSSVSRFTRNLLREHPESKIVIIGDKSKAQLSRIASNNIYLNFNQIGQLIPSYEESCGIASSILEDPDLNFDVADIIFNKFVSPISYESNVLKSFSAEYISNAPNFAVYEIPDGALENYNEFMFANNVHWAIVEGHAAEMAAKRAAMENATSNAGDLIQRLTLQYNRGRQAVITNQLIEVITGASAL